MDTNSAFEQFISAISGQSAANLRNYRSRLRHFLAEWGGREIASLSRQNVNDWHKDVLGHGHAAATMAGYRQAIKSFLRYCHGRGLIEENIASHLRVGRFIPVHVAIPDERDVQAITAVAHRWLGGDGVGVRRAVEWLYILDSGARLGGLHNLTLGEVKRGLDAGKRSGAFVFGSNEKTGEVLHGVSAATAVALERYVAVRPVSSCKWLLVGERGVHGRVALRTIQHDFARLCAEAGVAGVSPHALRHRVGDIVTRNLSAKIAQIKLGHADLKTTLNYYHNANSADILAATTAVAIPPVADDFARHFVAHDI